MRTCTDANDGYADPHAIPLFQQQILAALLVIALVVGVLWYLRQNSGPAPAPPGGTIRVATWNLRFFSTHRKSIPEPDFPAIAQIIRDAHFDLLAIQEVKGKGEAVDALIAALGSPYREAPLSPETGNGERFAFVYNAQHVKDLGHEQPINVSDNVFSRHPYQGNFQAGTLKITLITCHIFYGSEAAGHRRREQEVESLVQYARGLESRQCDTIVLGDFNEQHTSPNLYNFTDSGWQKTIYAQTNLAGAHDVETFDNILLDKRDASIWTGTSGSIPWDVLLYHDNTGPVREREQAEHAAANNISDHRPAYVDLFAPASPAP